MDNHGQSLEPRKPLSSYLTRTFFISLAVFVIGAYILQPPSVTLVNAQAAPTSTYSANSPHWSHINISDFGTNLMLMTPGAAREAGYDWYARHVDTMHTPMDVFSFSYDVKNRAALMKAINPTFNAMGYNVDLFMCEHQGCWEGNSINATYQNLPEDYYLHFSQDTHVDFYNVDTKAIIGSVDIPGCPDPEPVTAACRIQLYSFSQDKDWLPNVKNTTWQQWWADHVLDGMATNAGLTNPIDTLFLDGHGISGFSGAMYIGTNLQNNITSGGGIREYNNQIPRDFSVGTVNALDTEWSADVTNWLTYLRSRLDAQGKKLRINTGTTIYEPLVFAQVMAANGALPEFFSSPIGFPHGEVQYTPFIQSIQQVTANGGTIDLYYRPCTDNIEYLTPYHYTSPGNYDSAANRSRMWILANYYMVKESANESGMVYFNPNLCVDTSSTTQKEDLDTQWLKAYEHDVGQPIGQPTIIQQGHVDCPFHEYRDPTDAYHIYSRQYSKSLVLLRPRDALYCENYGDSTIVNVPLASSMVMLEADGTYSAPMNSVDIRNGEAVIMVPAPDITSPSTTTNLRAQ